MKLLRVFAIIGFVTVASCGLHHEGATVLTQSAGTNADSASGSSSSPDWPWPNDIICSDQGNGNIEIQTGRHSPNQDGSWFLGGYVLFDSKYSPYLCKGDTLNHKISCSFQVAVSHDHDGSPNGQRYLGSMTWDEQSSASNMTGYYYNIGDWEDGTYRKYPHSWTCSANPR